MRGEPSHFIATIVGPGALGIGLAHALSSLGISVRFFGRRGPIALAVDLVLPDQESLPLRFPCPTGDEVLATRLVFFAVKAYELEPALLHHASLFAADTPLIPVGNGLVEPVLDRFSRRQTAACRLGISTLAVTRLSPSLFSLRYPGRTQWGPSLASAPPTPEESTLFDRAEDQFGWLPNPRPLCRRKWLFNTALNSLCGIHGLASNGDALPRGIELRQLFHEAYLLGQSLWGEWPFEEKEGLGQLLQLVEQTRSNENSMAQDLRLGRPTENEFLAGLAKDHKEFPHLRAAYEALRGKNPLLPSSGRL